MSTTFKPSLMTKMMLGCIVFASFVLVGCEKKTPPAAAPRSVTVAKPLVQDVRSYETFDGNVSALLSVNLEARVAGYLTKILFQDGAFVKKDQLLFVIEQDQYLQQVKLNQAIYDEAKIEVTRQKALLKDNATSQASVDKAVSSFLQSEANLKLAQINYGYTEIRAPFDGLMGRHLIDVGNYLGSSASGVKLATIQKIKPIYVYFSINERDVLKFKTKYENQTNRKENVNKLPVFVQLQGEKGFPHEGILDFAANALTTDTGSLQLRAELPNTNIELLPGLYAKVLAEYGEKRQAFLIPTQSIQTDQQGAFVYLIDDTKKVQRRNLTLGQLFPPLTEVKTGLSATDSVIINGFINVSPGQLVNPQAGSIDPLPKR